MAVQCQNGMPGLTNPSSLHTLSDRVLCPLRINAMISGTRNARNDAKNQHVQYIVQPFTTYTAHILDRYTYVYRYYRYGSMPYCCDAGIRFRWRDSIPLGIVDYRMS